MLFFRRLSHALTKSPARIPLIYYRHLGLSTSDVFLASYPRSGNTWVRFILSELLSGRSADFINIETDIPEVGGQRHAKRLLPDNGRLIKTHEPFRVEYRKAIYLVRDPRAVVLSELAYLKMLGIYDAPLEKFIEDFIQGKVNGYGFWGDHIRSWLEAKRRGLVDMALVKFEDLRSDTYTMIEMLCRFLDLEVEPAAIHSAIESNSLRRMRQKEDEAGNAIEKHRTDLRFVRAGAIDAWKQELKPDQKRLIESATKNLLVELGYAT